MALWQLVLSALVLSAAVAVDSKEVFQTVLHSLERRAHAHCLFCSMLQNDLEQTRFMNNLISV